MIEQILNKYTVLQVVSKKVIKQKLNVYSISQTVSVALSNVIVLIEGGTNRLIEGGQTLTLG